MTGVRSRPAWRLTTHFFKGLFDFGVLSDVGASSFKGMLATTGGVFVAFGLLLLRIYAAKYANLGGLPPETRPYVLLADQAFLIALPMWIVAFVTVLVGHALFPDETDFWILMALPVSRQLIFGAKLLALALFTGLFVAASTVSLLPMALLVAAGGASQHGLLGQLAAHLISSLLGSALAIVAIVAVHGLLVLFAPRRRVLPMSAAVRSAMLCALVVSLPLLLRLPAQSRAIEQGAWWLLVTPPMWFVAVESWLVGGSAGPAADALFRTGILVTLTVAGLAVGSYAVLYRSFDRVIRPPAQERDPSPRSWFWRRRGRSTAQSVFVAIRSFTLVTLRRSVLHQGILVALSATGVGLVLNSLIRADFVGWSARGGVPGSRLVEAVALAPFALIFVATIAVRAALSVPIELRANWVFRITQQDELRVNQLDAAAQVMRRLGVLVPVALLLPVQIVVLGVEALIPVVVAVIVGTLLVELLMRNWARIPFTCTYIPGKGFVPQSLLIGVTSFIFFTTFGAVLSRMAVLAPGTGVILLSIVAMVAVMLRWRRVRHARWVTLEFEDELPTEVNPLRLNAD